MEIIPLCIYTYLFLDVYVSGTLISKQNFFCKATSKPNRAQLDTLHYMHSYVKVLYIYAYHVAISFFFSHTWLYVSVLLSKRFNIKFDSTEHNSIFITK